VRSFLAFRFEKKLDMTNLESSAKYLGICALAMGFGWSAITYYAISFYGIAHPLFAFVVMYATGTNAAAVSTIGAWPMLYYTYAGLYHLTILLALHYRPFDPQIITYDFLIGIFYVTLVSLENITFKDTLGFLEFKFKLLSQKEQIGRLLDTIPADVSMLDQNENYLFLNKHLLAKLNIIEKDILGKHIGYQDSSQILIQELLRFKQTPDKEVILEMEIEHNSSKNWHLVAMNKLDNGDIIILSFNIQNLKNALNELEKQKAHLINSARLASIGEMAGGIAHEVNNPLAIIAGMTSTIKRELHKNNISSPRIDENFVKIEKNINRITGIIKSLRTVTRKGELDSCKEESLYNVINDMTELVVDKFKRFGIEYNVDLPPHDLKFECRRVQLEQVLINLLNNSADAVAEHERPWIKMKAAVNEDKLIISITDSGAGIKKEIRDKLMTPFFTTKEPGKGTGLGLSISQSIIEQHNGKMFIDAENANTCFIIELPIASPLKISA
jgi:signal transduction histidine kinase